MLVPGFRWIRRGYLIYNGARFISILWAYHTFILAKSKKNIECGRRSSADLSASFALSVLSLLSPPLTSSRLSRSCLGDLKYPWLGWPTSPLAGWLSWRLEVAPGGWR